MLGITNYFLINLNMTFSVVQHSFPGKSLTQTGENQEGVSLEMSVVGMDTVKA